MRGLAKARWHAGTQARRVSEMTVVGDSWVGARDSVDVYVLARLMHHRVNPSGSGRKHRGGFSLIELVTTMAIMSVLLVALGSAILLASKALPNSENQAPVVLASAHVADQITAELEVAKSFTVVTATAVEFTVADRDTPADGDETIRYEWSGTPGDPITRQYNGGAVVNVLNNVQEFGLVYKIVTPGGQTPPGVEGPEVELSSFDVSASWSAVTATDWYGQYFQPSLPADAIGWRVSRVIIMASKQGGTNGIAKVQLRPADVNNLPTSSVLEEQLCYESSLGSLETWNEFTFTNATNRSPGEGLCLVLEWAEGNNALFIYYNDSAPAGMLATTDSGASWNNHGSMVLMHYIYGYVITSDPNWIPVGQLKSVRVTIDATPNGPSRIQNTAVTFNEPVVTP